MLVDGLESAPTMLHERVYLDVDATAVIQVKGRVDEGLHGNDASGASGIVTESDAGEVVEISVEAFHLDLVGVIGRLMLTESLPV